MGDWQKILDDFSGSSKTTSSKSKPKTSTSSSKKKKDDWQSILDDFSGASKTTTTPVTTKKKDSGLDFFQKGAFDDGWQFGDISMTVGSSLGDLILNAGKGVAGMGEGLVDLGAYGVAAALEAEGRALGDKEKTKRADDIRKRYQKNAVDDFFAPMMETLDENSVFGRTSDSIAQAGGQIASIILTGGAAGAAGVSATAATTGMMGLSGMGSGMSQAYQEGATDGEALTYGAISGAADALSELMFGGLGKAVKGVGLSHGAFGLDDMLAKKVSGIFKNQIAKNIAEAGIKAGGEGFEEVVAGTAQAIGKKLTYADEKELSELIKDENLLEQFIVGAVASGISQAPSVIQASTHKNEVTGKAEPVDFITGFTQDEQAVIDKEIENRIAEQEADGKKLTKREKNAIAEQVEKDLDKGYISIDTIESVLSGDNYKTYKDVIDEESSIRDELKGYQTEFDELNKKETLTLEETARKNELPNLYTEAKARLDNADRIGKRDYLKANLDNEVYELTKGSRLTESFHENARAHQKFAADVSKYKGKGKALIQSAIDSDALDNTRKMHEFMDTLAHIADDSDRDITIANQDKILDVLEQQAKEEGRAFNRSDFDGKVIDGVRTKNGIILNPESKRALNFVAGHEITHNLEKSGHYKDLYDALMSYGAEEYQKRFDERAGQYKGIYAEENYKDDIDKEVAADMVGDYLFTDYDFVSHLSTKHQNVFQWLWDGVKHLYKLATAGSKEARELEKVKRAFEKAYKESGKAKVEGTKHSLSETTNGLEAIEEKYKDKTDHLFLQEKRDGTISISNMVVKEELRDQGIGTEILNDVIAYANKTGKTIVLTPTTEYGTKAKLTKWYKSHGFVENKGRNADYRLSDTMYRLPDEVKYSLSDSNGKRLTSEQAEFFKDSKVRDDNGNLKVMYHGSRNAGFHIFDPSYSDDGISLFFVDRNDVATTYSSTSETYEAKTIRSVEDMNKFLAEIGQDEDYSVVEQDGKFTLLYDGDRVAQSDTAQGIYKEFCWYEGVGEGDANYKVYLNLKNPLEVDAQGKNWNNLTDWSKSAHIKAAEATVKRVGDEFKLYKGEQEIENASIEVNPYNENIDLEFLKSIMVDKANSSLSITTEHLTSTRDISKWAKANGYDGVIFKNIVDNGGYSNGSEGASTVAIAFDSNQIKSVANEAPTADKDIRYSLSEDNKGRELPAGVKTRFANSKAVDENGNLKAVYHGTYAGEFTIFDKSKGSVEGDFGSGFYFTDNEGDVERNYEGGGPDYENKVARLAEWYESEEELDYDEAEERAREELFKGGHKFEVYLNIENPAIVGETVLFDMESYNEEYDIEDYDDEDEYYADVEQLVSDTIDNIVWDVERYVDVYNPEGIAEVLWGAVNDGGIDVETLKARLNELYLEDSEGNLVANEVARQVIESLGYDGIIDPTVTSKFSNMGMESGTTHYIVFKPNQIKAVTNQTPTDNPDIHLSISEEGQQFKRNGGWQVFNQYNIRGEDVALAPVEESVDNVETTPVAEMFPDDLAPVSEEYEADRMNSLFNEEAPPENERVTDTLRDSIVLPKKHEDFITKTVRDTLALKNNQIADLRSIIREYAESEYMSRDGLFRKVKDKFGFYTEQTGVVDEGLKAAKQRVRNTRIFVSDVIRGDIPDYGKWKRSKFGKIRFSNEGLPVDVAYQELADDMPEYFPDDITNPTDQLMYMADFMDYDENLTETREIGDDTIWNVVDDIAEYVDDFKEIWRTENADRFDKESFDSLVAEGDAYVPPVEDIAPVAEQQTPVAEAQQTVDAPAAETNTKSDDEYKKSVERINKKLVEDKMQAKKEYKQNRKALADRNAFISNRAKELYDELRGLKKGVRASNELSFLLDFGYEWSEVRGGLINVYRSPDVALNENHAFESIAREAIGREYETRLEDLDFEYNERISQLDAEAKAKRDAVKKENQTPTRKEYHQRIIDGVKAIFKSKGFDFDKVLDSAKNLSTFATVDNTPQRVMEKALGYKEGGILADITVNKVAQNETEGIKWLNNYVAELKQISKDYRIKPGSKESAAAQMYAEGFYVNDKNEVVAYGDNELAQDFKNLDVQRRIKGLARDPRIRKIYDDTLANINESRVRNLYPEIQKLDNYFLHFRAMEDTFSTLGLPFNPNDIRAKDLPTDLNGVTADLKPGQPYFASAMHRKGQRTSFDLLGGVERYLNSAKNQIYHIDDIQTLRALRNYIAETYGQATGLEDIDSMTDAEAEERIKQVYGSHLSTFAKFLNEEANVLAGKTALIDRGIEGVIGRRGMTFLDTLNKQVGSNMVGYNISSSLTNFLPVAQAFAKSNKFAFTKAFTQTVANKLSGGKFDSFTEDSPVVIRRKGSDRFYRTAWQKMADPGYALMGMVDDISTELIARTKYNELTGNGMDSQKAHFETDKWVSRLMGDRSLGQQPQVFNSKMLGIVTKFQLEVRNQLDAQFYDTIQETKVSNEHIQNGLARNAKTAAKVASVFTQLAVVQHLYGKAFEAVAGYNPAFDIISVLATAFGFDDEEDDEDTIKDNLEQGFEELVDDLPYASIITGGGRIPISSALPIKEFFKGEDQYGNEKSRWETISEVAPYYVMPGGYGQLKKTVQGLNMFSDEHPIAGSYTDAGNLRFNVEDTVGNRIKAGIFGQYASKNARKYFDQEQHTLNPEQTAIFAGLDIPIEEYWEYRDKYNEFKDTRSQLMDAAFADGATDEDQLKGWYVDAINDEIYDLYEQQKEIASGSGRNKKAELRKLQSQMEKLISDSQKDMNNIYINGYYAEVGDKRYDYSTYSGGWYEISGEYLEREENAVKRYGITPEEYWNDTDLYYHADWYFDDKYASVNREVVANLVFGGKRFAPYAAELGQIKGEDKNRDGRTDSGSKKANVFNYIAGLNLNDGEKKILRKMSYPSEDKYNYDIVDYLNARNDISYSEMETILKELGFKVSSDGTVSW